MMLNPVLRRESRTTLRSWKLFAAIAVYVAITVIAAALYLWNGVFYSYSGGFQPSEVIVLYVILAAAQLMLVLIMTPALTAGSISGERERQTLDLMLTTKMSPLSIVFGKLASCLSIVFLMILSSVPVFAVVFYFGGISLLSLFEMTLFLLSVCCFIGAVSIFLSTLLKRTAVSMVLVYLFVGVLCLGTLIVYALSQAVYYNLYQHSLPDWVSVVLLSGNPGMGFLGITDAQLGYSHVTDMLNITGMRNGAGMALNYFWLINIVFNLIGSVLFVLLSARKIRPVCRTKYR